MAECYRCGSEQHFERECDYDPPVAHGDRPHGYSLNTNGTYLAEIEDSEGHPMALRVKLQARPVARPPCTHQHARGCYDGGHMDNGG